MVMKCKHQEDPKVISTAWDLTEHCERRMRQRSIDSELLMMALEFGEEIFKQGAIFHVVTKKSMPTHLDATLRRKLENLVVMVSDDASVITCYRNKEGMKYIKKKSKYLRKNSVN